MIGSPRLREPREEIERSGFLHANGRGGQKIAARPCPSAAEKVGADHRARRPEAGHPRIPEGLWHDRTVAPIPSPWPRSIGLRLTSRPLGRRTLGSVSVPFDFDEVFDADYLFFYEPLLADVTEADVDAIWRLLKLEPDMAVLDLAWDTAVSPTGSPSAAHG